MNILQQGWATVWASLSSAMPALVPILAVVGVVCMIVGGYKIVMQKISGGGGSSMGGGGRGKATGWFIALIVVGVLAVAPNPIIGGLAWLFDIVINLAASLFSSFGPS
jgi:hypothetical protein